VTLRRSLPAALATLCLGVAGAGCGSEDSGGGDAAPEPNEIAAVDFAFEPDVAELTAGDTVTWTNDGETIHNVKGKGFFSEAINPGDSYEHEFAKPGTYEYLCNLHPDTMQGTIEVTG
jgi:plastocyanin